MDRKIFRWDEDRSRVQEAPEKWYKSEKHTQKWMSENELKLTVGGGNI
jgi:predicted metal-binding protein